MAAQPAHVHAPRTELRLRVSRPADVRVSGAARRRRCHRGGRRDGGAARAARRTRRPFRPGGLAARQGLQRGDRRDARSVLRHRRSRRGRGLLPCPRDRLVLAAGWFAAHAPAPARRRAAPRLRPALLVQPDRVPERVDDGTRGQGVPDRGVRTGRAALQHPLRQRRSGAPGRRRADQQDVRSPHRAPALAARGPDARGQHPHRAQPGGVPRGRGTSWWRWPTPCAPAFRNRGRGGKRHDHPAHRTADRPDGHPGRAVLRRRPRKPGQGGAPGTGEDRGGGRRGDLPAARRRPHGQPAVLLPGLPRPADVTDHRPARLARRRGPGGRTEVDLQLPRQRHLGHPPGVSRPHPQRPHHRLPLRLHGELDHQRRQDRGVRRVGRRPAQQGTTPAPPAWGSSGRV
ncbi:hypothetical protein SVIOM74S_03947 [Streptomyces violarus]